MPASCWPTSVPGSWWWSRREDRRCVTGRRCWRDGTGALFAHLSGGKASVVRPGGEAGGRPRCWWPTSWPAPTSCSPIAATPGGAGARRPAAPRGGRRPLTVRAQRSLRRVAGERPGGVGHGWLPAGHRRAGPRAAVGAGQPGPAAGRRPRRVRRPGRPARAAPQRLGPGRRGQRTGGHALRPRLAGVVVGGLRAGPDPPAERSLPGGRRLGLLHADRAQRRPVRADRTARPLRRAPGRRPAHLVRQHPPCLRGGGRLGGRAPRRGDRGDRAGVAPGGHARARRRRGGRRRAARGPGRGGSRGRPCAWRPGQAGPTSLPRPALPPVGHALPPTGPGPRARLRRPEGGAAGPGGPGASAPVEPRTGAGRGAALGGAAAGPAGDRGDQQLGRAAVRPLPGRPRR